MRVIGHRGAAGLALENTLESIRAAVAAGAHAIEIDVRLSRDRQVVLCHDATLERVSGDGRKIADLTYDQLKKIKLHNGERVPLLADALKTAGNVPVIIETKVDNSIRRILGVIDQFPKSNISIASFKYSEIAILKELRPHIAGYIASRTSPLDILYTAKAIDADGIDLNFWILNPLTYWIARRKKLDVLVYTVNQRFIGGFIRAFYPGVKIITNRPDYFIAKKRGR